MGKAVEAATIYAIVGADGKNIGQDASRDWFTDPGRDKEFTDALGRFISQEGDKAVLGKIGAVWDGRWIFWHRR